MTYVEYSQHLWADEPALKILVADAGEQHFHGPRFQHGNQLVTIRLAFPLGSLSLATHQFQQGTKRLCVCVKE